MNPGKGKIISLKKEQYLNSRSSKTGYQSVPQYSVPCPLVAISYRTAIVTSVTTFCDEPFLQTDFLTKAFPL